MKIDFNHNGEALHTCFGISDERAEALNNSFVQIMGDIPQGETAGISNLVEKFIEVTESDTEVVFLTFILGTLQA